MKYILKKSEPVIFKQWKEQKNENWQPNWDNFQEPEKSQLKEILIKEQGYICCYCCIRINEKNSHIEHLKPRNLFPDLSLDYHNLIVSCQGESKENPFKPVHCGHKKANWYEEDLMISPLDINCSDFFRYTVAGEILSTNDTNKKNASQTTIEKLALNIDKLIALRNKAIEGILEGIEDLNEAELSILYHSFKQRNEQEKYTEFCEAIAYFLKQYLGKSKII